MQKNNRYKVTTNKTVRVLTAPNEATARNWAQILHGEVTQTVELIAGEEQA